MEICKPELSAVEAAPQQASAQDCFQVLSELQLALVGGGCGETML